VGYLLEPDFWLSLLVLFMVGSLLSGFYPAIVLSSFKPVSVLKGKVMRSGHGHILRQSLVVFQFAASVCLIVGSLVVYEQVSFMRNRDLGVDIVKTLVVKSPGIRDSTYARKMEAFKAEALRLPGITSMTASTNVPGDEIFWASGIRRLTRGPETNISGYTVGIDQDYVTAFGLKLIAGRGFDREHPDESKNMIINRSMAEALDWKDPHEAIGQKVVQGDTFEIVGVLENYHQMSLKESITPLVYRFTPGFSQFFAFKVESDNYQEILAGIEGPWKELYPGNPIDYFLLDQFFNRQYEGEQRFGRIFGLFTLLAIFIACMGLFGLASFMTMQRTKEIGIRKVLGSTTPNIVLLLSRGFIQLVLVANLIAWPIAYYLMTRWLEGFPYHIAVPPLLFLMAGCGVVLIAFLSVGFQTMKAALVNPAQTLKYE
jgi:putative ABC transport system permease protein